MAVFRPLVHRHFRGTIAWEVEKHLYRLAAGWNEAIGAAVEEIIAQAHDHVREELDMLAELVTRSGGEALLIEEMMGRLASLPGTSQGGAAPARPGGPSRGLAEEPLPSRGG
jgi:hypothetical protein